MQGESGTLPTACVNQAPCSEHVKRPCNHCIESITACKLPLGAAQAANVSLVQGCGSGTWMKSKTSYMTAVMSSAGVSAGSSSIV